MLNAARNLGKMNLVALVVSMLCLPSVVLANPRPEGNKAAAPLLVFPVEGSMRTPFAELPEVLTRAIASHVDASGERAIVAAASFTDTRTLVGCRGDTTVCLRQIARALAVERMVITRIRVIERDGESVRVQVTAIVSVRDASPRTMTAMQRIAAGDDMAMIAGALAAEILSPDAAMSRRSAAGTGGDRAASGPGRGTTVAGSSALNAAAVVETDGENGLARSAGGRGSALEIDARRPIQAQDDEVPTGVMETEASRSDSPPGPALMAVEAAPRRRFSLDQVERTSWAITGAGGGAMAAGAVFWLLANQRQGQIDSAQRDSVADLQRLEGLEDSASRRALIGNVLVVGGLATVVVGTVMAVRQGLRQPYAPELPPRDLTSTKKNSRALPTVSAVFVPSQGAGLFLTWRR